MGAARAARADAVWPASGFLAREDIETVHRAGLALGCEGNTVAQSLQFVEWGVDMVEQNELASLVKSLSERSPSLCAPTRSPWWRPS